MPPRFPFDRLAARVLAFPIYFPGHVVVYNTCEPWPPPPPICFPVQASLASRFALGFLLAFSWRSISDAFELDSGLAPDCSTTPGVHR